MVHRWKGRSRDAEENVCPPRLSQHRSPVDAKSNLLSQNETDEQRRGQRWICKWSWSTRVINVFSPRAEHFPSGGRPRCDSVTCNVFPSLTSLDHFEFHAQIQTESSRGEMWGYLQTSMEFLSNFRVSWDSVLRRHCLSKREGIIPGFH